MRTLVAAILICCCMSFYQHVSQFTDHIMNPLRVIFAKWKIVTHIVMSGNGEKNVMIKKNGGVKNKESEHNTK